MISYLFVRTESTSTALLQDLNVSIVALVAMSRSGVNVFDARLSRRLRSFRSHYVQLRTM